MNLGDLSEEEEYNRRGWKAGRAYVVRRQVEEVGGVVGVSLVLIPRKEHS